METLERQELYDGLKAFLLKEFDEKKKKKELLSEEREKLESEKNKKSKKLFQTDESGDRRKLFSPLNTIFYPSQGENFQDRKMKTLNYRIEKLDEEMNDIASESDQIEEFLNSLQVFFPPEKEEKTEDGENLEKKFSLQVENNLSASLANLKQSLESQYNQVEFLFDLDNNQVEGSVEQNQYFIEILYDLIQTSIDRLKADTFLVEIKNKDQIQLEVEILASGEKIDHCTFIID